MLLWLLFRFIALFTWVASKLNTPNDAMGVSSNILVVKTRNSQYHFYEYQRRNKNMKLWIQMIKWFDQLSCLILIIYLFLLCFRKHIEVHGRSTPAVFRSEPEAGGQSSYELTWTVDSYSAIIEYRLLYRQIQPYHKVRKLLTLI